MSHCHREYKALLSSNPVDDESDNLILPKHRTGDVGRQSNTASQEQTKHNNADDAYDADDADDSHDTAKAHGTVSQSDAATAQRNQAASTETDTGTNNTEPEAFPATAESAAISGHEHSDDAADTNGDTDVDMLYLEKNYFPVLSGKRCTKPVTDTRQKQRDPHRAPLILYDEDFQPIPGESTAADDSTAISTTSFPSKASPLTKKAAKARSRAKTDRAASKPATGDTKAYSKISDDHAITGRALPTYLQSLTSSERKTSGIESSDSTGATKSAKSGTALTEMQTAAFIRSGAPAAETPRRPPARSPSAR